MDFIGDAFAWILDPAHQSGPSGIPARIAEHLVVTAVVVGIAAVIALPAGFLIGHTGRGRGLVVALSGALRALPTLGILVLVAVNVGIGLTAPIVALVLLAIPPILAGAYAGVQSVDRAPIDAAQAVGMTPLQVFGRVELPLALPLVISGIRSAVLQVVATATLAAYVANVGLGRYLFTGLKTQDYPQMLAGSLIILGLALLLEGIFALVQFLVVPAGVRIGRRQHVTS